MSRLLCPKCGHHIHDAPNEKCHWYDCPCDGKIRLTKERLQEIREHTQMALKLPGECDCILKPETADELEAPLRDEGEKK